MGKIHFHNSAVAMAYIKVVSNFQHGLITIINLVASQIKGSELSTKEPQGTTEKSANLLN